MGRDKMSGFLSFLDPQYSRSSEALIPDQPLGKFLLLVGAVALLSSLSSFLGQAGARKVYSAGGAQVTPLSARCFGTWNFTSAIIRIYAAYNLNSKPIYDAAIWTYIIALAHFGSEVFVYKTAKLNVGIISPFVVASSSLVALLAQYGHY